MTVQFVIQKTVQKSSPLYSESCAYDYVVSYSKSYPKVLHYIQNLVHMTVQFVNKKTVQKSFPIYSESCG